MAELALTASPSESSAHDLELHGRRKTGLPLGSEKAGVGGLRRRLEGHTGPLRLLCQGEGSFETVQTEVRGYSHPFPGFHFLFCPPRALERVLSGGGPQTLGSRCIRTAGGTSIQLPELHFGLITSKSLRAGAKHWTCSLGVLSPDVPPAPETRNQGMS